MRKFIGENIQIIAAVYHGVISSAEGTNPTTIDLEKYPPQLGITVELCAGIVDKTKPLVEIAREEILEEVGYNVPVDRIETVLTYRLVEFSLILPQSSQ